MMQMWLGLSNKYRSDIDVGYFRELLLKHNIKKENINLINSLQYFKMLTSLQTFFSPQAH